MRYAGEKRFNGWTALTLLLLALFLLFYNKIWYKRNVTIAEKVCRTLCFFVEM